MRESGIGEVGCLGKGLRGEYRGIRGDWCRFLEFYGCLRRLMRLLKGKEWVLLIIISFRNGSESLVVIGGISFGIIRQILKQILSVSGSENGVRL